MDDIPQSVLYGVLLALLLLYAFFSSCETGMMALNRYRLRHLVKDKHRGATLASKLLDKPDRLIGLILLGSTLVNSLIVSVAALIAVRSFGELGIVMASLILTPVLLIFGETAPKTYAAINPEKIAFPSAYLLTPLLKLCYPFVYILNKISNGVITLFGINLDAKDGTSLNRDELRTIVHEAGTMIPLRHQRMLLNILDLENETVDDIMIPRNELAGIDLNQSPAEVLEQLIRCQHTRLILYRETIDNITGMLHIRHALRILRDAGGEFDPADLEKVCTEPYYIPEGTPLHTQLFNFQRQKKRNGLVVDEYGVILGIVTLEDILEEIVGEFTTDLQTFHLDIHPQPDGSFIIDGTASIRDINRQLHWQLPADGPKTLNGLILEQLENIPETGTSLRIGPYTIEITQAADHAVKSAKVNLLQTAAAESGE